ncbi:MAG: RNA polymerase sigma factor [Deltaproteobacteria bacterium]|nr:MAG: RNA polymerase sigma factor [Deltaproteobacteria bacterium]
MDLADQSDERLMAAYVAGNETAFAELFHRYGGRLLRVIRRQVRSEDDAREIVQQTFLHLHRARHDFRSGATLRPWIFTIALNLKREYFRRRGRRPEAPLDLDGRNDPSVPAYDPTRHERAQAVRAALASLPPGQREVIELHWFSELSFQEVAVVVGASVSAVKVRAHRGYGRLRKSLSAERPIGANQRGKRGIPGEQP